MTAVRKDLVHIDILDIRGTGSNNLQPFLGRDIILRVQTFFYVCIDHLGIDGARDKICNTETEMLLLFDHIIVVQHRANDRRTHCLRQNGRNDKHNKRCPQRSQPCLTAHSRRLFFFRERSLLPSLIEKRMPPLIRDKMNSDKSHKNDQDFIRDVKDERGNDLSPERRKPAAVKQHRQLYTGIKGLFIQAPGHYAAETTAY